MLEPKNTLVGLAGQKAWHICAGEGARTAVDDLLVVLMSLAQLPELKQLFGLDLEQPTLNGGSPTQPPQ
jgi:hypothetical protein